MAPRKKKETKFEKELRKIYYTPKEAASFSGVQALQHALQKKGFSNKNRKKEKITKWLSSQDTYTLHKPVRRHFSRSKVIVGGIDHQWQADLVDVSRLVSQNRSVKYLLTCIDIFSKYAWVLPLKNKTGDTLVKAFENILFQSGRKPIRLQCDQGKEFTNATFQQFLKKQGISFFTTYNEEIKASVVERFNRTLKSKMWKYFTRNDTQTYVDVLDDLVRSYNHSYHRSIKMQPVQVNQENQEDVWQHLYGEVSPPPCYKPPKFRTGDQVRISKFKKVFKKGYSPNWSEEIFTIDGIKRTVPVQYYIRDESDTVLKGSFYEQELQKIVKKNTVYHIEAILDERKKKNRQQILVKWTGYPSSMNSWIYKSHLRKYKG